MNFLSIMYQLPDTFWILIVFALLAPIFKSAWFKGRSGEFLVNLGSKLFLDKTRYRLIHNVTLPTEDGTTQIDHIIVSQYGVFVVETKNMKGWIFGDPYQRQWTQKIYKHSNKFQNPLHQNHKHLKAVQAFLKLSDNQVFSIVVFTGECTFKTEMPENVTYPGGYIKFVKSKTLHVLTESEVKSIINTIEYGRLTPSFQTNHQHKKYVKKIMAEKENAVFCPKCGSAMILRQAKQGQNLGKNFWGCSRFPKCRGMFTV